MIELCEATEDNPFIHGMSKQFVKALQQLFDVMDTEQMGTIRFVDLANQWEEDDGDPFFPKGLIPCLAKVQLSNGLLTFDRFCAGIKLCLLKNQVDIKDIGLIPSSFNQLQQQQIQQEDQITNPNEIHVPATNSNIHSSNVSSIMIHQPTKHHHHQHNNAHHHDRPSSEPQIFAPPPPPSLSSPSSVNNNNNNCHNEVNNNNIIYHNHNNNSNNNSKIMVLPAAPLSPSSGGSSTTFNNSSNISSNHNSTMVPNNNNNNTIMNDETTTATMITPTTSTTSLSAKKLPLPSYEQVMAAKSKPTPKLPNEIQQQQPQQAQTNQIPPTSSTSSSSKLMVDEDPSILIAKNNFTKVINQFESQYGTANNGNRIIKPQQQQQQQVMMQQSQPTTTRAKSMSHLDYMSSSEQSCSSGMNQEHQIVACQQQQQKIRLQQQPQPPPSTANPLMMMNKSMIDTTTNPSINPINSNSNNVISKPSPSSISTTPSNQLQQQQQPKTVSRNCIMKTLQSWRDNILNNNNNKSINNNDLRIKTIQTTNNSNDLMLMIDSNHELSTSSSMLINNNTNDISSINSNSLRLRNGFGVGGSIRRREPRRHTVGANGIDLYSVKRFQQLEQEKEILIRGLNEIEKTKDWYIRQITSLQDKINFAGRCGTFPSDCNIDSYQERINFQAIRIQTLNQHLISLRETGQTFPLHMNLAIRPINGILRIDPNQPKQLVVNPNLVNRLKEQNRLLTDEVTRKSERITQLEREKSSLIRELFQARTYSSYYNGHFDDTFM